MMKFGRYVRVMAELTDYHNDRTKHELALAASAVDPKVKALRLELARCHASIARSESDLDMIAKISSRS